MTRVSHASSHRGAHTPTALNRPRAVSAKKKKPYKIVLEAVTQEKRKLQSILTYHDQAPSGFGYIPVGYPEFTEWCKEQCRQRNLDVHIVSAKPKNRIHADPEKISNHVHRIGHHFPLDIIELACNKFGYQFTDKNGLQKQRGGRTTYGEAYFERGIADYEQRQRLHGRPVDNTETKDNIRGAVREMFPKIPEADLTSIVNHAFQEGTNRVGNAKELSLARRVQLAVVAHIRHTYTEYDNILKTGSWAEARQKVEHVSLAKLKEWRDEAGQASNELEETFREVIILDDDEESSDEETPSGVDEREPSMEIVSNRATARDLQPEPVDRSHGYISSVSRAPRRTIILRPVHALPRSPYVTYPSDTHTTPQTSRVGTRAPPPALEPIGFRPEPFAAAHSRPMFSRTREPVTRDAYPMQMRDSDGRLYNLEPVEEPRGDQRIRRMDDPSRLAYVSQPSMMIRHSREAIVQSSPQLSSHANGPTLAPSSRRASDQDLVLPSVEREPDRSGLSEALPLVRSRNVSVSYADVHSPKRKSLPSPMYSFEEHSHEPVAKRLRPVYDEGYARASPMETYGRPRVQPQYQTVDLTSSPTRAPYGSQREPVGAVYPRTTAGPTTQYVLAPSHRSPMRDVRGVYLEAPIRESTRAYNPKYDNLHDSRAIPPLNRAALREEAIRFQPEGGGFLRSGTNYGRYRLH